MRGVGCFGSGCGGREYLNQRMVIGLLTRGLARIIPILLRTAGSRWKMIVTHIGRFKKQKQRQRQSRERQEQHDQSIHGEEVEVEEEVEEEC